MIDKHFPKRNQLHKVFNRNIVKISYYSCTRNLKIIIQAHNKKILNKRKRLEKETLTCNCREINKDECPMPGQCKRFNVVYQATTEDNKKYIGCTENFKARWSGHKFSFSHIEDKKATALSKHVWEEGLGEAPRIAWEILATAQPYRVGGGGHATSALQKNC